MKKFFSTVPLFLALVLPAFAQASIFDDLVIKVRDLQKQVVDLVSIKIDVPKATSSPATDAWTLFVDDQKGFEVRYPSDWSTTSLFALTADYKNADAFVRNSRADFLAKIVKPSSTALEIAVQDSAIFFQDTKDDEQVSRLATWAGKVSTSTKTIGSSTALYILHSVKTDPAKFGGGATEKYVFQHGSSSIVAEANYSSDRPAGPVKVVFERMLGTFAFVPAKVSFGTSTLATSTTATSSLAATSSVNQSAGVPLSQ